MEGGPQNFGKEGIVGKKKKCFQMNLKNPTHSFDKKTKFLLYPVKHCSTKKKIGLNTINYPKNNIIIL